MKILSPRVGPGRDPPVRQIGDSDRRGARNVRGRPLHLLQTKKYYIPLLAPARQPHF